MRLMFIFLLVVSGSWSGLSAARSRPEDSLGVRMVELRDRVRVELNGKLFTEYYFTNVPRPFCYPLIGPGGKPMTRNYPMKPTDGEEEDHPHHRSVWFTHGAVNGHDFWSEAKGHGVIVHTRFEELRSGPNAGRIRARNEWRARDGKVLCTETRIIKFYPPGADDSRIMDWEITLHASHGDLVLGDTKEGSMAIRVAESMRVNAMSGEGKGRIITSEGKTGAAAWGTRAAWCDYYGPVDDQVLGVAMFDHPSNPRHPTWWHVREYGLFAANPFGQHDFEKAPKGTGDLKVPAGRSITFKYRIYLHQGDEKAAGVAEQYKVYAK